MANEIHAGVTISFSKGGAKIAKSESFYATVSGDDFSNQIQAIGTSEEALEMSSEIATLGYILIKNLDATNYVEFGIVTGVYTIKLKAGEICLFRPTTYPIYAKADTDSVTIESLVIED
jgi:hypothetical protein